MASVLIVDDSPLQCRLLAALLRRHGHRVDSAVNLVEARRVSRRLRPCLTLVELVRFHGNGFGLAQSLGMLDCGRVVPFTARGLASDALWARARGLGDCLRRPLNPAGMPAVVAELLQPGQEE